MDYVEEREFTLRFEVRCTFPPDYEGEQDGGVWAKDFDGMAREIVQAAAAIIQKREGWRVRPGNRGRSSFDEVTLVVEREPRD